MYPGNGFDKINCRDVCNQDRGEPSSSGLLLRGGVCELLGDQEGQADMVDTEFRTDSKAYPICLQLMITPFH